jgi:hypothetical protein
MMQNIESATSELLEKEISGNLERVARRVRRCN